ncbi:MAG: hypothetical protein MJ207_02505 [Bacilli bacterium]|nr:hypothetical protein [Bacilli bacterium]
MKKTKLFYLTSVALLAIPTTVSCSSKDDFDILLNEYRDTIIASTKTDEFIQKGPDGIRAELSSEEINGVETYYYPNINYEYGSDPDRWDAATHPTNMLAIAVSAAKTHDNRYQEIAVGMTYYWIYHDYRNVNWWFNDLRVGSSLANTALFVYNDLNSQGKAALRSRVARTSFYYKPSLLAHSGSNLFDYAELTLKSSIINRNREEFELAVKRMEDEIVVDPDNIEGFRPDGSFFQHGAQVQTMSNYGRSVIRIGNILRVVDKTSRHFSLDKLRILTHFILRGIGRGTFKGYSNYLEMAREYARKDETAKAETYLGLEAFLDLPNLPARHEFENFIQNLRIHRPTFNGITYFSDAHLVTMILDNLYISFEGSDPSVLGTETVNGENKLGLNLSYGTNTCVMDEGPEYYQIAPYWDYAYLPGTTSIQVQEYDPKKDDIIKYLYSSDNKINTIAFGDKEKKIPYYDDGGYEKKLPQADDTKNDYVYSSHYDEENNVVILMQRSCHHAENNFTVTCIACEDGMFLVGADLKYTGEITTGDGKIFTEKPNIHTTIEQCFYKGENFFELSDDKKSMTHGRALYKTYDDGSGENATNINVRGYNEKKKMIEYYFAGDWNRNKNGNLDEDMASPADILLAYLDTNENGKYAYSIQPASYDDREFKLINNFNNDQMVQEVKLPNGKVVVVAYEKIKGYKPSIGNTIDLKKGDYKII